MLTLRVEHLLDGRADEGCVSEDDKLKSIARDERNVLARFRSTKIHR